MLINELPGAVRAGSGSLAQVWRLPAVDFYKLSTVPAKAFRIDAPTLSDGEGLVRLPVRSIGRIGADIYFSTDLRFVCYVGADCVWPVNRELALDLVQITGGWRGALLYEELRIVSTGIRKSAADVLAQLSAWSKRQSRSAWIIPARVLEFESADGIQPVD